MLTESVEGCPHCDSENVYKNWDVKKGRSKPKRNRPYKYTIVALETLHEAISEGKEELF